MCCFSLWSRLRGKKATGGDGGSEGGDDVSRAVARAASAASALGGRDKDGLPLELDMDNYDNDDGEEGVCGR